MQWNVAGNIKIIVTNEGPWNAVVSGIFLDAPTGPTAAAFLEEDTATEGNWIGTYGTKGYDVIGNAVSIPSDATVTAPQQQPYVWSTSTTATSALENAPGTAPGRTAACWNSGTNFTVDVELTGVQMDDLELYFLDSDGTSRAEQVTLSNAFTGAVLDTETISSFHSGVYLNWEVSGNVLITITKLSGANAVLSGLFLDPPTTPTTPTTTATFINRDTTTEGNWIGAYGSQGYDVIGNTASIPSYAKVIQSGQQSVTWTASTTDPRALRQPMALAASPRPGTQARASR